MESKHYFEHKSGLLIGLGALGSNIYSLCSRQGILFSAVVEPEECQTLLAAETLHYADIHRLPPGEKFDFMMICVPDPEIKPVVWALADFYSSLEGTVIFHTSGFLTAQVLLPLVEKGADTGAWHPMMTFNRTIPVKNLNHTMAAVEGDPGALAFLENFSRALSVKAVAVTPEDKGYYHLLGVFASNFVYGLFGAVHTISERLKQNGSDIHYSDLAGITRTTLDNLSSGANFEEVISGPVKRRDFEAVRNHLRLLRERFPDLLPLYREQSKMLAGVCGYSTDEMEQLERVLAHS